MSRWYYLPEQKVLFEKLHFDAHLSQYAGLEQWWTFDQRRETAVKLDEQ